MATKTTKTSIRKGSKITLKEGAVGFRLMTDEEYNATWTQIRDSYVSRGMPMMDCAGEPIIVSRNKRVEIGNAEVIVESGRARWNLDYTWNPPKNMMAVRFEGQVLLTSRKNAL